MRRYGSNRKNPNPPWPNEQSVLVVPPGASPTSVGMPEEPLREMRMERNEETILRDQGGPTFTEISESERDIRRDQIMGNTQYNRIPITPQSGNNFSSMENGIYCTRMNVTGYLCGMIGKYVKLEFLFGENTHMEKIGRLHQVGKDFVAIRENGTDNIIVCDTRRIKFINIYEFGWQ